MSRRRVLLSIVASLLAVAGGVARADEAEVRSLDEQAFLAAVEQTDPRLERLAAEVDVASAEILAEGVRANPSIALDREEVFPDDGLATNYARLVWPLDVSGRRGRRVAAARTAADAVAADTEASRFALTIEALRAFYEAAHARLYVDTLRAERDTLVRVVEAVRKRTGAGAASGYDLQRFELELAAYDDLLASAETALSEHRARVATLVGTPDEPVDASSSLEVPAAPPPLDELLPSALEGRGDYRAAKLRAESADRRADAAARGWIPAFGLTAGFMSSDVGDDTAIGYTIGLSFTLPVFDRGKADGARARAAKRVAEADARVLEARVPSVVRTRHATLERRIEQAKAIVTEQLSRLDDLLRAAETAYREGEGSVVELLDAYQAARDTRLRDLELRRDARLAELDLWLALGRRP